MEVVNRKLFHALSVERFSMLTTTSPGICQCTQVSRFLQQFHLTQHTTAEVTDTDEVTGRGVGQVEIFSMMRQNIARSTQIAVHITLSKDNVQSYSFFFGLNPVSPPIQGEPERTSPQLQLNHSCSVVQSSAFRAQDSLGHQLLMLNQLGSAFRAQGSLGHWIITAQPLGLNIQGSGFFRAQRPSGWVLQTASEQLCYFLCFTRVVTGDCTLALDLPIDIITACTQ